MTRLGFGLALLLAAIIGPHAAAQDIGRGRELATRWCSGCHVVDRATVKAPADAVPAFPSLVRRTDDQLRAAMNPLHGKMPDLSLSKVQQDDLVAYIKSLATN